MEQKIERDGNIVTITTTQTEVLDIEAMRSELELLENEPQPTTEQIIEAMKNNIILFYYSPEKRNKVDWLKSRIIELENI